MINMRYIWRFEICSLFLICLIFNSAFYLIRRFWLLITIEVIREWAQRIGSDPREYTLNFWLWWAYVCKLPLPSTRPRSAGSPVYRSSAYSHATRALKVFNFNQFSSATDLKSFISWKMDIYGKYALVECYINSFADPAVIETH